MRIIIAVTILLICSIIPVAYWIAHPDLSQMEILLHFWWLYLSSFIVVPVIIFSESEPY